MKHTNILIIDGKKKFVDMLSKRRFSAVRGSRRILREPGGEIPLGYSPIFYEAGVKEGT